MNEDYYIILHNLHPCLSVSYYVLYKLSTYVLYMLMVHKFGKLVRKGMFDYTMFEVTLGSVWFILKIMYVFLSLYDF